MGLIACWTGPHCAQEDDDTYAVGKELGICQGSLGSLVYLYTSCAWDYWTSTPAFPIYNILYAVLCTFFSHCLCACARNLNPI